MRLQSELEKTSSSLRVETERETLLLTAHNDLESNLKSKESGFADLLERIEEKNKEIKSLRLKYEEVFESKNKIEKEHELGLSKILELQVNFEIIKVLFNNEKFSLC